MHLKSALENEKRLLPALNYHATLLDVKLAKRYAQSLENQVWGGSPWGFGQIILRVLPENQGVPLFLGFIVLL
jgi:hypothetical protein